MVAKSKGSVGVLSGLNFNEEVKNISSKEVKVFPKKRRLKEVTHYQKALLESYLN